MYTLFLVSSRPCLRVLSFPQADIKKSLLHSRFIRRSVQMLPRFNTRAKANARHTWLQFNWCKQSEAKKWRMATCCSVSVTILELDGILLFSTRSLQPLKCNLDVKVAIFTPRCPLPGWYMVVLHLNSVTQFGWWRECDPTGRQLCWPAWIIHCEA